MESIGIGTLAKRAGVGVDTVRYYERTGLLKPNERLASGYRRYSSLEVRRLRFIRKPRLSDSRSRKSATSWRCPRPATLRASSAAPKSSWPISTSALPNSSASAKGWVCW